MLSQYRVIFGGSLIEGRDLDEVKHAAAARLKLSPTQVETIFSGQKIVLKKGLSSDAAMRYSDELEKVGMRVRVQEMRTATPAPAMANNQSPKPAQAFATVHAEIGTASTPAFNSEKTDIYDSAIHDALYTSAPPMAPRKVEPSPPVLQPQMKSVQTPLANPSLPKPVSADDSAINDAKARHLAAIEDELKKSQFAPKATTQESLRDALIATSEVEVDEPPLLGVGFQGRVSRVGFLIGSIVVMSAAVLLTMLGASFGKLGLIITAAVGALPFMYLELRLFALRFHDVNAKGEQLCVLALIPGINALTLLYLVFFPGNHEINRYGSPGSTAGPIPVLISISIFALIVIAAVLRFPKELLVS